MKITAQEEYGLRVLIRIASCKDAQGISIPQLSEAEGLSSHYIAKLARTLRIAEVINSTPGNKGGYVLARPAKEIIIRDVLAALGGVMFDREFCDKHHGTVKLCTNSVNCSARSLWNMIQFTVDKLLSQITLHDLVSSETESMEILRTLISDDSIVLNREAFTS
ncbi:MAG: Rrf2 family transcriptional regulator [Chitinophagaceae bacterium]|nr:MAG: Rrf2 family transcriptional regulator [Chitinophagaceae bacterium]